MEELPLPLYTADQVRELDRRVIEGHGVPGWLLMQRAARAAYAALRRRWPDAVAITVLCGPGNNGGDGLLVARLARLDGLEVRVGLLRESERYRGDARRALKAVEDIAVFIQAFDASMLEGSDVIVDAMLGTGLSRDVEGNMREAIEAVNRAVEAGAGVLAVDIPSGLNADTGTILGEAVNAHVTSTFIGLKLGQFTGAGVERVGQLLFHDLEAPDTVFEGMEPAGTRLDERLRTRLLPPRSQDAHKNRFGHVLCIGGDHGTAGAIRMTAEACLRSGAGLVSVATRAENAPVLVQARPELMCVGVEDQADLLPLLEKADVIAVGPGLGQSEWGRTLWEKVQKARPMVVDADALNLLARSPVWYDEWILTPHPGEAARLLDSEGSRVQTDRPAAARDLANRYGGVAVLKGAGTLVAGQDGGLDVCGAGNPGMAVGGMGDTLTGVIAALLAQGLSTRNAARLGVWLHARAADEAAGEGGERGLLPGDLLPWLRRLVNP